MPGVLHLALGDSAAGSLREACRNHGLPGTAHGIPDDLSHGPLDDGRARIDYMRACFRGYDDWYIDLDDAFAPWRAVLARIDELRIESIVFWSGKTASEATFLAMAYWCLRQRPERVLRVTTPGADGRHYVALYQPGELAGLFESATTLTHSERDALGRDFLRICNETAMLRRWEKGWTPCSLRQDSLPSNRDNEADQDRCFSRRTVGSACDRRRH